MTTKPRTALRMLLCPECAQKGTIQRIIYGLPDPENFDFEKYAVGGCCITGDGSDADIRCKACDWSGFRALLEGSTGKVR